MKKYGKYVGLIAVLVLLGLIVGPRFYSQQATTHGVLVSWTASTTSGVTNYIIYRAPQSGGSCTGVTGFTQLATVAGTVTSYNDPTTDLSTSTGYCYEVDAEVGTNLSGPSNVASVTTPATWPVNPTPPSGCTATNE